MDPKHLLEAFGTIGLIAIVFAETGLLVGFFLPGDSLLVLAGLFAALGDAAPVQFRLPVILVGLFVAAVIGAQTGYYIGHRAGPALLRRPDSRFFKREHVDRAEHFFNRYGAKTIVIARFIPIVRTFANPIAGVARMDPREFALFNVVGAFLWTIGVTMLGYLLGKQIPSAQDHVALIEGIIILLSVIPVGIEFMRSRRRRAAERLTRVETPQ